MSTKIVNELFEDIFVPLKWHEKVYFAIYRKVDRLREFFKEEIYQRLTTGFPHYQSWNFCSWHAKIVVPRLKMLKKDKDGVPCGLTEEQWDEIIDKIIWAFEHIDDNIKPIYSDDFDHRYEVTECSSWKSYKSMNKIGTVDFSPVDEHNNKVQEGLNLFAKHYRSLWS